MTRGGKTFFGEYRVKTDFLSANTRCYDPSFRDVLRELYSHAQRRLTQLVPAVPLYENHTLIAHHRRVRGVVHDTSHNTAFLACAWLDPEDRS